MAEEIKRPHDVAPSAQFAEFMRTGWSEVELKDLNPLEVVTYAYSRRQVLSEAFPEKRIVIPAGSLKVRSNDTDYQFRPHSDFIYYSGVQGSDTTADAVLVLEPNPLGGHDAILFINPRSTRDTDAFYRDARYGELWVGRRFTVEEAKKVYQLEVRMVSELERFLHGGVASLTVEDSVLTAFASEQRIIKDSYEVKELQRAVEATALGFNDVIASLPAAIATPRGERVVEAAFFGRARIVGNDLGYNTIAAAGAHACTLHWVRNDGDVKSGELILIDAGVEMDSFYTADITRTLPISGKFSAAQRALYLLVYEAQRAAFEVIRPGVEYREVNSAAQRIIAQGLIDMGVLDISLEETMLEEVGLHRRWTLHGVSHHLGLDVHDCAQARKETYNPDSLLREGMVITVEPGLYIQPDDELFAPEFRGIGIRIEDDVLITADGYRNLSAKLPRHPDEIEAWMAAIQS